MRRDKSAVTVVLGVILSVAIGPTLTRAEMRVLASNVSKYPRGTIVMGNVIKGLGPGQWVKVWVVEDMTTRTFGTLPVMRNQPLGTRDAQ